MIPNKLSEIVCYYIELVILIESSYSYLLHMQDSMQMEEVLPTQNLKYQVSGSFSYTYFIFS